MGNESEDTIESLEEIVSELQELADQVPALQTTAMDELDEKDGRIMDILRGDSRRSTQSIATELDIPRVTVYDRIRRMQEKGLIRRFTVEMGADEILDFLE